MAITRRKAMATANNERSPPPHPKTPPQISSINEDLQIHADAHPEPIIAESASDYELFREQRIKENRERLQKLGIVDLSLKLKSMTPSTRTPRSQSQRLTPLKSPLSSSEPVRRSSRLQNVTPVSYTELKEEKSRRTKEIVLEEGARPEVYNEEHEKLLGNTDMPWTFFVDGYRPDGTRIYDPVNGKTCHQCRQKTLGLRTRCSKCNLVQGQFCGDCLYMRYGEHVVEANQTPNWLCPPCRGICNCSLCRQAKGWAPTGALYRRISSLGFKSVAHYLIMTKRTPPISDKSSDTQQQQPAKRSLPFDDENGQEINLDEKNEVEKKQVNPEARNQPHLSSKEVGRSKKRTKKGDSDGDAQNQENIECVDNQPVTKVQAQSVVDNGRRRLRQRS